MRITMLFNAALNSGLRRSLLLQKTMPIYSTRFTETAAVAVSHAEEKEKLLAELKEELPQPYVGPERDYVNYPKITRLYYPGKVRMAIFPDEWFTYFYKKTGVTGPYVFGAGLLTFLLSKELYVIEEELSSGIALFTLIYIFVKKFGPQIRAYTDKLQDEQMAEYHKGKSDSMKNIEESIQHEKKLQWETGAAEILISAKRENVMMQLETEYRRRLADIYQQVKKRLDYHLDIDNTRKKMEQKHMVEWIVSNVVKSITPQQEKEALQKCVADLKALAARA